NPRQLAKDSEDESKVLDGHWKVVALEENGSKAPTGVLKGMSWSFKNSEVEMVDPPDRQHNIQHKASVKLDWSKTPKHIDFVPFDGAMKGKMLRGIFTLEKDRLVICLRDPGSAEKGRPQEFKTEAGSGLGMITLERDPPSKREEQKNDAAKGQAAD